MKEPYELTSLPDERRPGELQPELLPPARATRVFIQGEIESIKLTDYAGILWRRKLPLFLMALLGVLGALAFSLSQRPVYRATASVQVGEGNDDLLRGAVSGTTPATGSLQGSVQTEASLLREDSLIEQVVLALGLDYSREFVPPRGFSGWVRERLGREESLLGTRRTVPRDRGPEGEPDGGGPEGGKCHPDPLRGARSSPRGKCLEQAGRDADRAEAASAPGYDAADREVAEPPVGGTEAEPRSI